MKKTDSSKKLTNGLDTVAETPMLRVFMCILLPYRVVVVFFHSQPEKDGGYFFRNRAGLRPAWWGVSEISHSYCMPVGPTMTMRGKS